MEECLGVSSTELYFGQTVERNVHAIDQLFAFHSFSPLSSLAPVLRSCHFHSSSPPYAGDGQNRLVKGAKRSLLPRELRQS